MDRRKKPTSSLRARSYRMRCVDVPRIRCERTFSHTAGPIPDPQVISKMNFLYTAVGTVEISCYSSINVKKTAVYTHC